MKKYMAAGAVAIMVFAFAAFAASLDVGDSVLAAGSGEVTHCGSDTLPVHSWGSEVSTGEVHNVTFARADLADCIDAVEPDDYIINVQLFNAAGSEVGRSGEVRFGDIPAHATRATIPFQTPRPLIENIDEIRVLVQSKSL